MLQTVNVRVTDVKERRAINCNLIFDGGNKRTYLSQQLVDKLKLNYIDWGDMRINAFGNNTGMLVSVKQYEFCGKGKQDNSFYLNGFSVPVFVPRSAIKG